VPSFRFAVRIPLGDHCFELRSPACTSLALSNLAEAWPAREPILAPGVFGFAARKSAWREQRDRGFRGGELPWSAAGSLRRRSSREL